MHLKESGEMYLETILILSGERATVRSVDVGEYMGYSKPSVSRAVGLLREGGYITVEADGNLRLTEEGRSIAEKTYERHRLLTSLFTRLGVPADIASADACKIEHHMSDETFDAIRRHAESGMSE